MNNLLKKCQGTALQRERDISGVVRENGVIKIRVMTPSQQRKVYKKLGKELPQHLKQPLKLIKKVI